MGLGEVVAGDPLDLDAVGKRAAALGADQLSLA